MIKLELVEQCWLADFSESLNNATVFELFGTFRIPTAYTAKSSPQTVLNAIRVLNDEQVVLA